MMEIVKQPGTRYVEELGPASAMEGVNALIFMITD